MPEFETLCDLDFCTCRDPFGRVRCVCPAEVSNTERQYVMPSPENMSFLLTWLKMQTHLAGQCNILQCEIHFTFIHYPK